MIYQKLLLSISLDDPTDSERGLLYICKGYDSGFNRKIV